ncbi:MAG: hypothetical protein JW888_11820 [Pirellulales bacterium]|nr:hypothetical protein [Pirellulales bacterium]
MKNSFTLVLLGLLLLVRPVGAIELSQDFDSGSLNVAASAVVGNTVHLVGRRTWTQAGYTSYYRWVYFKASSVAGLQPQFDISSSTFLGTLTDHRYLYSYDQSEWNYFDNCYTSGSMYYFSNNQPFTQDEVYVAYSLPYPLARTQQHMAAVVESPFVCPTASGCGDFVIGRTAGGIDDLGRTIAPNDLYGFKITDPYSSGEKAKVLLSSGNHPCETPGSHAFEGAIDFLLSDAPEAVGLRRLADFYVYPQINPDGRVAGYYRSTPENPDKDYNRYWDNPTGFTDMTAVRDAMILDTGGDIDYLFDFHSSFGPWTRNPYYAVVYADRDSPFALALAELEPDIDQSFSSGASGMLRIWAQSSYGLNAEHAYTPEFGCHPGVLEERLDEMGANYIRALYMALGPAPESVPGDATGDGVVDEADAARLAEYWGATGVDWMWGDFDDDGFVGPRDAAILAAHWTRGPVVPEPSVVAMLLVGLVVLLPRRLLNGIEGISRPWEWFSCDSDSSVILSAAKNLSLHDRRDSSLRSE